MWASRHSEVLGVLRRGMVALAAVLLCGGKGSRMLEGGVTTHKPLLEIGGVPATKLVIGKLMQSSLDFSQLIVVIPPGRESEYHDALRGVDCKIITQKMALGTGNAVYTTLEHLLMPVEHVYVSFGTQPLIENKTVEGSYGHHIRHNLDFTLATVVMDNPYAPLLRDKSGQVCGSVETHLDGAEMPARGETNIGAYWASRRALDGVLDGLHTEMFDEKLNRYSTVSGELGYPNEMVKGCLMNNQMVDGIAIANEQEMMGIKTPETLAAIRAILE
jgi:bifunctional N-acetylglucosamine-1-phosphate-uridyltransferase/glucosamine-1-phosphate-acetyltransferase GlmU-like protein